MNIVPDLDPLAILPFIMIATLLAIVLGRKTKANAKSGKAADCHYAAVLD